MLVHVYLIVYVFVYVNLHVRVIISCCNELTPSTKQSLS